LNSRAELFQKFLAQAIKAAIGHDQKKIAGFGFGTKMFRDGVGAGKHAGIFAERADTFCNGLGVKAILVAQLLGAKNAAENDAVAEGKRLRQRFLKEFDALWLDRLNGDSRETGKLTPDGNEAEHTKIMLGRGSVNAIEIRQGLNPGDRVILSDMSANESQERIRLQ